MGAKVNIARWWNEFDEEKYVCADCMAGHGEKEVTTLLSEGCGDDRERFHSHHNAPSHPHMSKDEGCALCGAPLSQA